MIHFFFGLWMLMTSIFHNQPVKQSSLKEAEVVVTSSPTPKVTISPSPKPLVKSNDSHSISISTIDCVGPDGKHLKHSQSDCDKFNAAWENLPTPTPLVQSSSNSNTSPNTPSQSTTAVWEQAQAILQEKQNQYNTCVSVANSGEHVCEVGCQTSQDYNSCLDNCSTQFQSALNVCVAQSKI